MKNIINSKIIRAVIIAILVFMMFYSYCRSDTGNTVVYCIVLALICSTEKMDKDNSKKE